jgi:glutamine synthetase
VLICILIIRSGPLFLDLTA